MKSDKKKNKGRLSDNKYIKDIVQNREVYILFIPVLVYYIVFKYLPMTGAMIAFKDYIPSQGILGSPGLALNTLRGFLLHPEQCW